MKEHSNKMGRSHEKEETLSQVINRRRNAALDRQDLVSLLFRVVFLALAGWFLFSQVFLVFQHSGSEMFPAVKDGDLIIGFRLQRDYAKNDVIVYQTDDSPEYQVGRIAARETDVVTMDDSGALLINGTPQSGEILYPTYAKDGTEGSKIEYPYRVPEGQIFILGDYRTQTKDSRDFGPVAMDDVKCKVITILRRRGL